MRLRIAVISTLAAVLPAAVGAKARRVSQSLPTVRETRCEQADSIPRSILICEQEDSTGFLKGISFDRYDKPTEATREVLFITNNTDYTLSGLTLRIDYFIPKKHMQLHSREVTLRCEIGPGETRCVDFASWDRQKSYHYAGGRAPKRRASTPYDVGFTTASAIFLLPDAQ